MAARGGGRAARQSHDDLAGHARAGSAGRNRQATNGFGRHGHRRRPALHGGRPQPVQPSARCPDRTAGVVGVDGMTEHRGERPGNVELADALAAVRARIGWRGRGGRRTQSQMKLNCCPITKFFPATDVLILSRLGLSRIWRIARTGSGRENSRRKSRRVPGAAPIRWHMVGRIQRNKARSIAGWAYAAHSVDSAKLIAALDRAAAEALGRRRAGPNRCGSTSSSASTATSRRGGVDIGRPGLGRRTVRRCRRPRDGLEFVGLMAHPAAGCRPGRRPSRVCRPSSERVQQAYQQRLGLSAGMSSDLESGGQTWFDVCACRYRAIGATTANVTMSSHSSHIFITDTRRIRRVQR